MLYGDFGTEDELRRLVAEGADVEEPLLPDASGLRERFLHVLQAK